MRPQKLFIYENPTYIKTEKEKRENGNITYPDCICNATYKIYTPITCAKD